MMFKSHLKHILDYKRKKIRDDWCFWVIINGMFKKNIPAIVSCLENSQNDWELRLQAIEKLGNLIEEDDGQLI